MSLYGIYLRRSQKSIKLVTMDLRPNKIKKVKLPIKKKLKQNHQKANNIRNYLKPQHFISMIILMFTSMARFSKNRNF